MATAAVLTGTRSLSAIAEWAADAPQPVRAALGARRDAPDHWAAPAEATIRRTLSRLEAQALAGVIGAWLTDRDRPTRHRRAIAVDGKTLRGARRDGRQSTCWPRWTTPAVRCWPNARSTVPPARFPGSGRCWPS
jgi:hypothetical protein